MREARRDTSEGDNSSRSARSRRAAASSRSTKRRLTPGNVLMNPYCKSKGIFWGRRLFQEMSDRSREEVMRISHIMILAAAISALGANSAFAESCRMTISSSAERAAAICRRGYGFCGGPIGGCIGPGRFAAIATGTSRTRGVAIGMSRGHTDVAAAAARAVAICYEQGALRGTCKLLRTMGEGCHYIAEWCPPDGSKAKSSMTSLPRPHHPAAISSKSAGARSGKYWREYMERMCGRFGKAMKGC